MSKDPKDRSKKAGLPPGSLVHLGGVTSDQVKISVIDYTAEYYKEIVCKKTKECFPFKDTESISWINLNGLHDTDAIARVGTHFGIHPLSLEDILNTGHRPKVEEFKDYIFLTLKILKIGKDKQSIDAEQISFTLGKNWLISFQEKEGDIFNTIRQRLRESTGNLRKSGPDYLVYRLIDITVDNYFFITEYITEASAKLEEDVLDNPDNKSLQEIQRLKKLLISLRKSINPLREAVSNLQKDDAHLVTESTQNYLRDVYEHIILVIETIEIQRDSLGTIMDLYLSGLSNKTNQVMQVLTIISTIFIPLTFIVGVYGMNFENMPELKWRYGYLGVWGFMVALFVILVLYFRRKRWL